jgi:N-acetylmuramoyl-L-alanine amidase
MNKKTPFYILFALILATVALVSFTNKYHKPNILNTIILDAGHGGKDPGASCHQHSCTEAQVTLGVTLKLGQIINDSMPNIKVHYTRTDDSYPTLGYRANFANEKKGDLFVSIHCNSASNKSAQGLETYVWIPNKNTQKTNAIADRENAEIYNDPNFKETYGGGVDINSTEFIAKAKLRTKKYFTRSTMLANLIQNEGVNVGRNDRSVKQRGVGIWVLQATAMPSVLVETGYISNPDEASYLLSDSGQNEMALLIAKAIIEYNKELLNKNNSIPVNNEEKEITKIANYFLKPSKKTFAQLHYV